MPGESISVIELGRMPYAEALAIQRSHVEAVLAAREAGAPETGRILLVEHDPVITISRRTGARQHLLADQDTLARLGVAVEETDRGGDITYHGPGQLVVYPILDLNRLNLGLHAYMRLLEQTVIDTCSRWDIRAERDAAATGVWVRRDGQLAKIAAMGVRIRKWVSMHGLALNIAPDMSHFQLIVPCGLADRPVTSLSLELRGTSHPEPTMPQVTGTLTRVLVDSLTVAARDADQARDSVANVPTGTPPRSGPGSN